MMQSSFKRLNRNHLLGLLVGFAAVFLFVPACKKKERLTSSNFNFSVTPAATTVVKTQSVTLTARGPSEATPTWAVSSSTLASISPTIGNTVVFTANALGDVVVTATDDGVQANSQIAIVTFKPTSNTFDVYTDNGLPTGPGILSDIFVDGGLSVAEISTGYAPEGIKYQRTTDAVSGDWGITLDKAPSAGRSTDLSSYSAGSLKFALRVTRQLTGAETFLINIADKGQTKSYTLVRGTDFSGLSTDWQEISLSLPAHYSGLDLSHINVPFAIVLSGMGSALTFDVDAVRWEK